MGDEGYQKVMDTIDFHKEKYYSIYGKKLGIFGEEGVGL